MEASAKPLKIAIATRPHPAELANGDGWCAHWSGGDYRVAVIDGLGHGPEAAYATDQARDTLDAYPDLSPIEAVARCHDALNHTRGAAMAVARVSAAAGSLAYAAVGNIEAEIWTGQRMQRPIAYRGIVGRILPHAREQVFSLDTSDWLMLSYSDGIRQRFDLKSLPEFAERNAQGLADRILNQWHRPSDDAIVVVMMPRRAGGELPGSAS